jgi:hypothetical protein
VAVAVGVAVDAAVAVGDEVGDGAGVASLGCGVVAASDWGVGSCVGVGVAASEAAIAFVIDPRRLPSSTASQST